MPSGGRLSARRVDGTTAADASAAGCHQAGYYERKVRKVLARVHVRDFFSLAFFSRACVRKLYKVYNKALLK